MPVHFDNAAASGTDVCGGSSDASSVTTFAYAATDGAAADACVSSLTARADTCEGTGDASGGGTCTASDWSCADGILSSTSSSGVDTCGDGSNAQTTYYASATAEGSDADLCVPVADTTPPAVSVTLTPAGTLADGTQLMAPTCEATDICDDTVATALGVVTPSSAVRAPPPPKSIVSTTWRQLPPPCECCGWRQLILEVVQSNVAFDGE